MNSPAHAYGRFQPTAVALVADAVRRAWARIAGSGHGESRMSEGAAAGSGDLENLLARHDVRRGRLPEGANRVFRAPGLVFVPAASLAPGREGRPPAARVEHVPGPEQYSRLFKPLR